MIPLDSKAVFIHEDEDGTKYGFRYLTMRNQPKFYELTKRRMAAMKEIDKFIKNGIDEISDEMAEEVKNSGLELVDMFLVSVNGTEYKKPSEEFLPDQPMAYLAYLTNIIFTIMSELQGNKPEELKNLSRQHSSVLTATDNSTDATDVQQKAKNDADA
jgi:hypothetical protein